MSVSENGGLEGSKWNSTGFFFLVRNERRFLTFLAPVNSSPVPSLPSEGELALTEIIHAYMNIIRSNNT